MATPVLLSWSGGKDSLMALDRLLADPAVNVVGLLTTLDHATDRVAIHEVRGDLLRAQAHALGLPLIEMPIDWPASNETYLDALARALDQAHSMFPGINEIAFGDIHLADLRAWRESQFARRGWNARFPLWQLQADALTCEFDARGHKAVVASVDLHALDGSFCGREFDAEFRSQLPRSVDPCGENGEFHTFCHASPLYAQDIGLARGEMATRAGRFRYMDLRLA